MTEKRFYFFLTFRENCKSDNALLETHTLPLRFLEEHVQMEERKKYFRYKNCIFIIVAERLFLRHFFCIAWSLELMNLLEPYYEEF